MTLTLSPFDRSLPWVLGTAAGAVVNPHAIAAGTDLTTTSDGTGPYVVTDFQPNVLVSYERAEDENWDPRAGMLAGFTIDFLTDYQVALNGLQAGQFDMIRLNGLGSAVEQATATGDLVRTELPSLQTLAFWLNNQDPIYADPRVRQAFQYALDREGIANAVFDGGSECAASSQVAPFEGDPMYIEGYDPYPYDPEMAQQLLEEADAVGTQLTITDIGATNTTNLMQAAQPMLEAAGFEVELVIGTAAETAPGFQQFQIQTAVIPNAKQAHPNIFLNRYWVTMVPTTSPKARTRRSRRCSPASPTRRSVTRTPWRLSGHLRAPRRGHRRRSSSLAASSGRWSTARTSTVSIPRTFFLNMRAVGVLKDCGRQRARGRRRTWHGACFDASARVWCNLPSSCSSSSCLSSASPGDPAARVAGEAATQEQIAEVRERGWASTSRSMVQFANWVGSAVSGEFGDVADHRREHRQHHRAHDSPRPCRCSSSRFIITLVVGVIGGSLAALRPGGVDRPPDAWPRAGRRGHPGVLPRAGAGVSGSPSGSGGSRLSATSAFTEDPASGCTTSSSRPSPCRP